MLILLLGGLLALQLPGVQTGLARFVASRLEDKFDGRFEIGAIRLHPFNAVTIKDVVLIDNNPCPDRYGRGTAPLDTVARIGRLTATFSLRSILGGGKGIHLGKVEGRDILAQMSIEPDSLYGINFTRVFRLKGGDDSPMPLDSIFFIHHADLRNVRFRMVNFGPNPGFREHGINFEDMDVTADLVADDISFNGGRCHALVRDLRIREKCGYEVLGASAEVHVGMGHTNIWNLRMRDNLRSDINLPKLDFNHPGNPDAWGDFVNAVELDADFAPSDVNLQSTAIFGATLFKDTPLIIHILRGNFKGPISGFRVSDMEFTTLEGDAGGIADVTITGIPESDRMYIDAHAGNLFFTGASLQSILSKLGANVDTERFAPGVRFNADATMKGLISDFVAGAYVHSSIGSLRLDATAKGFSQQGVKPQTHANITTSSLDLGKLLGVSSLGICTMAAKADLRLGDPLLARLESADVERLDFNGYSYSGVQLDARLAGSRLIAHIASSDPNATADINASVDLKEKHGRVDAQLGMIDLAALGFDKRGGRSRISCSIRGEQGLVDGEPGYIGIGDLILENNDGVFDVGSIEIESRSTPDELTIALNSSILDAKYDGTPKLGDLFADLRQVTVNRHIPSYFDPHGAPEGPLRTKGFSLSAVLHDTKPLASFIMPDLRIDNGTTLDVRMGADGSLLGYISSTFVGFKNIQAKGIDLAVDNIEEDLDCTVSADKLAIGDIPIDNAAFGAKAAGDLVSLALNYEGTVIQGGGSEIYIDAAFSRDQRDSLHVDVFTQPSQVNLKGQVWELAQSRMELEYDRVSAHGFALVCDDQSIEIDGGVQHGGRDTLSVRMNRFDLSLINAFTGGGRFKLEGMADGTLTLLSPFPDEMGLFAGMELKDMQLGDTPVGDLRLHSDWDDDNKLISFKVENFNGPARTMLVSGNYATRSKSLDGTAYFSGMPAAVLTPVLDGYLGELGGTFSGNVLISGPVNALKIASQGINFNGVRGRVSYTNVAYTLDGNASVVDNKVNFNNIGISDDYSGKGVLSGFFDLGGLKDFSMDANLSMQELKAVDNRNLDKSMIGIFGDLAVSGRGHLEGPVNSLNLNAVISTSGAGNVSLPLSSGSKASSSDLLTFKERVSEDEAGEIVSAAPSPKGSFSAHARVAVSPDVIASIEIDKENGHMLTAGGTGSVVLDLNTAKSIVKLNGDYLIDKGKYLFNIPGIVTKEFDIREGSSLKFNGDLLESTMDVKAVHNVKTSLSTLVADSTSVSTRRNVECGLNITGKFRAPEVKFNIDVPDLDPSTKMQVDAALSTEDKVQKQFVALLLFGTFIPDEGSGVVNGSNVLYSNVGEIVAGQLNNILQKLDIPLDFGFGYQQDNVGTDLFDVAVSTQLFNNRLVIGGSLGNRRYSTSKSANGDVVGDLDMELKIDKKGELRFKLFSHSADEFTSSLDYSQRNGLGFSYQKEYNKVRDLIRSIFRSRKRKAEDALIEAGRRREVKIIEIK